MSTSRPTRQIRRGLAKARRPERLDGQLHRKIQMAKIPHILPKDGRSDPQRAAPDSELADPNRLYCPAPALCGRMGLRSRIESRVEGKAARRSEISGLRAE